MFEALASTDKASSLIGMPASPPAPPRLLISCPIAACADCASGATDWPSWFKLGIGRFCGFIIWPATCCSTDPRALSGIPATVGMSSAYGVIPAGISGLDPCWIPAINASWVLRWLLPSRLACCWAASRSS